MDGVGSKSLVVVMPQLGDFDTFEYAEHLCGVLGELEEAGIDLRVVGTGNETSAKKFADFTGLPLTALRVDPAAEVHRQLALYPGPMFELPDFIPASIRPVAAAWTNYMAMCAGIGAPGTLREILRGYIGDKSAPERFPADEEVKVGPLFIKGTRTWGVGGLELEQWWKDEAGYQRPAELATVRLRHMAEVLSNWSTYVPDPTHLAQRGGTFVVVDGKVVYQYQDRGVLTYSETMPRPLTFLEPYIGAKALNALGLPDASVKNMASAVEEQVP